MTDKSTTGDPSHVYGSLVISAGTQVPSLPVFADPKTRRGDHSGRSDHQHDHNQVFNTVFWTLSTGDHGATDVVALPQRNKYMTIDTVSDSSDLSECVNMELHDKLAVIDSQFKGGRQLYKVYHMMNEIAAQLDADFVSVINNESDHSSFNILSHGFILDVFGIYDVVNKSVQLAWSTDEEFINLCRAPEPTRYIFYRYPSVLDRPLFIYTQYLCAKWWKWQRNFGGDDAAILMAFNALEGFLYKDHTQPVDARNIATYLLTQSS
jgi:hypothetical protein